MTIVIPARKVKVNRVIVTKAGILCAFVLAFYMPTHYALIVNVVANGIWMFKL